MDEVRRALGWPGTRARRRRPGGDQRRPRRRSWEEAARAYRDAYAALLPEAKTAGVRLAIG
jgi:hypothetical protein